MADNTIQDIKDKLDIVEVMGRFVQLKKSGTNYKGLCPFHGEKTPSMMVSSQKQIWHCFGCGEGGDVIGFIKRYENVDFREALEMAAEMAGVQLPDRRLSAGPDKALLNELATINDLACKYFQQSLAGPVGAGARKYLSQRGVAPATIDLWRIGFAPDSFDGLYNFLQSQKIDPKKAVMAGVLAESEKGKIFDRFRGRIAFPIFDINGQVAAFTARVLPDANSDQAKYINSPETLLYNKSKIVFGLNFAKDAIRKLGQVVVVEGQMDAISAQQAGFKNTVATSGTALTEQHLRLLKRFTNEIVFAFDNDDAGRQAQLRAAGLALNQELDVRAINLQGVKDPDDLIRKSPSLWEKLVKGSMRIIDYYIEQARQGFSSGSLEQKHFIGDTILPLVSKFRSPVEIDHYFKSISDEFNISEQALRNEPVPEASVSRTSKPVHSEALPQELIWEKEILGGIIVYPEFLEFVQVEGLPDQLVSEGLQGYFRKALLGENLAGQGDPLVKEAMFMVESSLENLSNNELALVRELKKSFYQFKLAKLKHYLQELTIAMKKAESEKKAEQAKQLGAKFAQLTNLRFEIETKLREA